MPCLVASMLMLWFCVMTTQQGKSQKMGQDQKNIAADDNPGEKQSGRANCWKVP
jgi:hypothetical protein